MNDILLLLSIVVVAFAQCYISMNYNKYKNISNKNDITGWEVARKILDENGLQDVYVTETSGNLSDHYDPSRKVIKLSKDIYNGKTIASIAVAAHEVGHAIQHKDNYAFLKFRTKLVPFVNFASYAGYFAILLGCIFGYLDLIWLGIFAEIVILLFQLVTLPVEFDASSRALVQLKKIN